MNESTTVTVGLDVHASSIRLAAVRADQVLEERTLPYDEETVERALGRWPGVRCCYEAGPTGFGRATTRFEADSSPEAILTSTARSISGAAHSSAFVTG
jgi:hypothetical protein